MYIQVSLVETHLLLPRIFLPQNSILLPSHRLAFSALVYSYFNCDNSFDNNYVSEIHKYWNIQSVSSLGSSHYIVPTLFLFHLFSSCLGCSALFSNYPFYLRSDLKSHLTVPACQHFLCKVPDKFSVQAQSRCHHIFSAIQQYTRIWSSPFQEKEASTSHRWPTYLQTPPCQCSVAASSLSYWGPIHLGDTRKGVMGNRQDYHFACKLKWKSDQGWAFKRERVGQRPDCGAINTWWRPCNPADLLLLV